MQILWPRPKTSADLADVFVDSMEISRLTSKAEIQALIIALVACHLVSKPDCETMTIDEILEDLRVSIRESIAAMRD